MRCLPSSEISITDVLGIAQGYEAYAVEDESCYHICVPPVKYVVNIYPRLVIIGNDTEAAAQCEFTIAYQEAAPNQKDQADSMRIALPNLTIFLAVEA